MADSWKIDGNCNNCRRKNYCSKSCTLSKRRKDMVISQAINKAMGLDKIYDAMRR